MGDLKPLGSEKLQGDDKMKRILELTYYNQKTQKNNNSSTQNTEFIKESTNGIYAIVKEKDGYYVKTGINEQSLGYIGGLFMKNKNKFKSYAEALKRLELVSGQSTLNEATKYVLKTEKPKEESPLSSDAINDLPLAPETSASSTASAEPNSETPDPGLEPTSEPTPEPSSDQSTEPSPEMNSQSKPSDYMAQVQKFAGKLGQELRDQQQKMESDDIKYVLNMIISAVNLDKLDLDDIEDIAKKFERDEEEEESSSPVEEPSTDEPTDEPTDDELPSGDPTAGEKSPEDDLAERISKLETLISTKFPSEDETELDEDYLDFNVDKMKSDEMESFNLGELNENINKTLSKYFK